MRNMINQINMFMLENVTNHGILIQICINRQLFKHYISLSICHPINKSPFEDHRAIQQQV